VSFVPLRAAPGNASAVPAPPSAWSRTAATPTTCNYMRCALTANSPASTAYIVLLSRPLHLTLVPHLFEVGFRLQTTPPIQTQKQRKRTQPRLNHNNLRRYPSPVLTTCRPSPNQNQHIATRFCSVSDHLLVPHHPTITKNLIWILVCTGMSMGGRADAASTPVGSSGVENRISTDLASRLSSTRRMCIAMQMGQNLYPAVSRKRSAIWSRTETTVICFMHCICWSGFNGHLFFTQLMQSRCDR